MARAFKHRIEMPAPARLRLKVYCLGALSVCSASVKLQVWHSLRAKAIFEYLISRRRTPVSRDMLMGVLWPDYTTGAASNNLKTTIHDLRQILAPLFDDFAYPFILFSQGGYLVNPEIELLVDAEEFERLWTQGKRLEKDGQTEPAIQEFEKAEGLYKGDYMEDELYAEWTIPRREALKDTYLLILNKLAEHSMNVSDHESCIIYCHKILTKDACREDTYRRLMRCYSRLGQKSNALRWYEHCRQTIASELDSPPAQETVALRERLVKGEVV